MRLHSTPNIDLVHWYSGPQSCFLTGHYLFGAQHFDLEAWNTKDGILVRLNATWKNAEMMIDCPYDVFLKTFSWKILSFNWLVIIMPRKRHVNWGEDSNIIRRCICTSADWVLTYDILYRKQNITARLIPPSAIPHVRFCDSDLPFHQAPLSFFDLIFRLSIPILAKNATPPIDVDTRKAVDTPYLKASLT